MRTILFIVLTVCAAVAFASDTIRPASHLAPCAKVGNNYNLVTYKTQLGGFICGNNVLNTPEKAQKYYWDSTRILTAVAFWFGQKMQSGSPGQFRAKVYSLHPTTGAPHNLLGTSSSKPVTAVDTSDNFTVVTFANPIQLPDTFFVALDLTLLSAGDSIGLLSTIDSCFSGEQLAWEKDSLGGWVPMNDGTTITSWGLDIDMAIYPVGDFGLHTAIRDIQKLEFSFYPNPAAERILINAENANSFIRIYDLHGKTVYNESFSQKAGRLEIEVSHLVPGIYFLEMTSGGRSGAQKFTIER